MDTIKQLAELAFATRLKRLSERLLREVSQVYRRLDIDFEARWFSLLYTLNQRQGAMAITGLARTLGLTHTAINQLATEMIKAGLLASAKGEKDERQRLLQLTNKGRDVAAQLAPVWQEIRSATRELIDSTGHDILSALAAIESKLDEQDMFERVWLRLEGRLPGKVEICDYRPAFKKYFKALNYEWLQAYFTVEPEDEKMLLDPNRLIIKKGGAVLFACVEGQVVGTAALIRHADGTFELAKMAVTPKYQGQGIGKQLLQAILKKARQAGATEIFLQTNADLTAANHLYQKFGFKVVQPGPFDARQYQRPTFTMRLDLAE